MKKRNGFIGGVIIGVIIIIGLIVFFSCMKKVPAGYTGVVYDMRGGIQDKTLSQGWHFVGPTKKVTLYSIGIEQSYLTSGDEGDSPHDDSFETSSSDGKGLMVDLTFTYRYDPDRVTELFTRFKGQSGREVRDIFIKPNIISWTKEVTAQYPVTDILGDKRAELNKAVAEYVKNKFEPYGIIIENASLINIDADEETRAQVQRRVNAVQELELAQTEKKTAQVKADQEKAVALTKAEQEKETAIILAEQEKEAAVINAEQAKIKAEGQAEATRIKAQADAEANKLIAESLTPELIEKIRYERWDGKLPTIEGSSAGIFVNASDLIGE